MMRWSDCRFGSMCLRQEQCVRPVRALDETLYPDSSEANLETWKASHNVTLKKIYHREL